MDAHPLTRAAGAGGALLAAATSALSAVRPARKPLHPEGDLRTGRLRRTGSAVRSGVAWIDEPGEDEVVVRLSRAIGLPPRLPDIHGLALRVPTPDGPGDLLFASTGWGRLTRFLLSGGRRLRSRPMTTLLPYDAPAGPVLLGLQAGAAETYELRWARAAGPWHPFAVLHLLPDSSDDGPVSFDPVRHQIPGLRQYDVVRRLREPAYRRARASRADDPSPTTEESPRVH
ncbi:hypothetical protein GHK92_03340 [Nocardioides sp. dk4132]|uniref:hypothetical protein n=1 Tax=unclassified Nocardioides TaxID=2615069 RepID=UPI001297D8CC|nr:MULTISPECIES: hypothetical protein [unclassified Nocardioides]MQW74896.1 hypothetical protein [Nocardioides sp. dk4132]QGA07913.1 hypothetical protein GFH29_11270 [Nocardioides sp. dk884]